MTTTAVPMAGSGTVAARRGPSHTRVVVLRAGQLTALLLVAVWSVRWALPPGASVVNRGGLPTAVDLLVSVAHPALGADFLGRVLVDSGVTLAFATLGTAGALVVGLLGGLALSEAAWASRPPLVVRLVRLLVRTALVLTRSVHELIWALLLVSVLGLDPLVGVLAIALPFGAQTAKVFGETFDGLPRGSLASLRRCGARPTAALTYGLLIPATPLLTSYAFYRFECAVRSTVLLGVVGVGGLGQELVVTLASRNWDEVWTLVGAVVVLSGLLDLASSQFRSRRGVVSCVDWSPGRTDEVALQPSRPSAASARPGRPWRGLVGTAVLLVGLAVAWWASGVSLAGLFSVRTQRLTHQLLADLWPPSLPPGGWSGLADGLAATLAMAVLAMLLAVVISVGLGVWAVRPVTRAEAAPARPLRWAGWGVSRVLLLVLRSVPPTVWAVVALLVLFPGIVPGAVALGLYTGGILARLSAEAWESVDTRPSEALRRAGVGGAVAALAAVVPPSVHQLRTYTLYRFEICVRDTAVVGVVGAAGLGRLFAENLAAFRFPAITVLLIASLAASLLAEVVGRAAVRMAV